MNKQKIEDLLKDYNKEDVEKFSAYIIRLQNEKDRKTGKLKNNWIQGRTEAEIATLYRRVAKDGLVFDGVHITLQSTGISYDYIAYKNKMFIAYPESKIDLSLVYKDDEFKLAKESGSIIYTHNIADPFKQTETDIVGGYAVIKNKRGEFITILNKADIDKHRKVAKTDFIWRDWFKEMALKTIIKKACKQHFADIYENIEEIDNDNYELENPLSIDLEHKKAIDGFQTEKEVDEYYKKHKGAGKDFDQYILIRKKQINANS